MDYATYLTSPAKPAAVKLPENAKMAFTTCACCPCGSYNPSQDAYWCSKFHSHYDGSDGCSKGPYG